MRIGYRTIKTAIGAPIAIWIAQLLHLTDFVSAGILTILCIQVTRKRSLVSAWSRFAACIVAMVFSFVVFEVIGYNPVAISIMLFLFIPTTVKLKLTEGIVTSSVIIFHLYVSHNITLATMLNEFLLIVVGIGTALILNLYMPSLDAKLKLKRKKIEDNFMRIFEEFALYLRTGDQSWTGKEITETAKLLEDAKSLAFRDIENHILRNNHPYYYYFEMRKKQFELFERMLPIISRLSDTYRQTYQIAELFEELSNSVHPGDTSDYFLGRIKNLKEIFRLAELPQTREEFEVRANLFTLLNEIEQYLILKHAFIRNRINEKTMKWGS